MDRMEEIIDSIKCEQDLEEQVVGIDAEGKEIPGEALQCWAFDLLYSKIEAMRKE